VLYTDGAIEIYDEKTDEGFTEKKLIELVIKNIDQDIERKINDIAEAISKFNGSIRDDITLIAVKFL
jgi:serine phosphatase RsbU (regulator of sigma subunit)